VSEFGRLRQAIEGRRRGDPPLEGARVGYPHLGLCEGPASLSADCPLIRAAIHLSDEAESTPTALT